MTVLLDTGPILSLADRKDPFHASVVAAWQEEEGPFVTTMGVVAEASYLLLKYLGPDSELAFLRSWREGEIRVEPVTEKDLDRVLVILARYRDQGFGFVDAALFALAERLKIRRVLTLDHRHFDAYRPAHCPAWEHLLARE